MIRRNFILVLALMAAATGAETAQAATSTTTFGVTAGVLSSCQVGATALAFALYDPAAGSAIDAANVLTVICTAGTTYAIGLDAGTGSGATMAVRKMTSGTNLLNYTLYQNPGRTTVWGNTVPTDTVSAVAGILPGIINVYGRVFSGQNVPTGIYADLINVTLTY